MLRRYNHITYYDYIGYSKTEFSLVNKNQTIIISEALNFREEELERGGFGRYCLEQLDQAASALDLFSSKFIMNDGYLILYGPMIKGSHVYKLYE